jgi:hypothetical protein
VPFDQAMANLQQEHEQTTHQPGHQVFQAVVEDDCENLVKVFATNARNSLVSYMSMKSRWARQRQDSMAKSGKERTRNPGILSTFWLVDICTGHRL